MSEPADTNQASEDKLDEILNRHGAEPGEMTYSLKQAIIDWHQQEIVKARIDEVRFMASMIRHNPGKGYWNSFERNRIATLEAELSQTLKEMEAGL